MIAIMKLATYKDGSRDGQLVVVSADLTRAHHASAIATRLQQVLDDWNFLAPQLQDIARTLDQGKARHAFPFDPRMCMAPLPRAYRVLDACAPDDGSPGALTWEALPGDALGGPCEAIDGPGARGGLDFGPRLFGVLGDLPGGGRGEASAEAVRLLMLGGVWRLRAWEAVERARGGSPVLSRPRLSFAPVAVTPDELGATGLRGQPALTVALAVNGEARARATPAGAAAFSAAAGELSRTGIAQAGALLGLGPLRDADGRPVWAAQADHPLDEGDRVEAGATDASGQDVFGALALTVRCRD